MKPLFFSLLFSFFFSVSPAQNPQTAKEILANAFSQASKEHKNVFVKFSASWCGWCKKMDATTFSHPEIVKYVNENYYAIKFNAEQKTPITFNGKEYKFVGQGSRGYHELAAFILNNKMSYPTTVYLDEKLNILSPVPGYLEAPTFEMILTFFASEAYKTTPWEQYQNTFKGKL